MITNKIISTQFIIFRKKSQHVILNVNELNDNLEMLVSLNIKHAYNLKYIKKIMILILYI